MRRAEVFLPALLLLAFAGGVEAGAGSRFYLRLDAGGSMHPSDQNLETAWYTGGPDYDIYTDRESQMLYHFDQKFGASIAGGVGYRWKETIAFECALGYVRYWINEVNQDGRHTFLQEGERVTGGISYEEAKNVEFGSILIRSAVRLQPSVKGKIALYFSGGADVAIVSGSGELVFEVPGTAIDVWTSEVVPLEFDGTDVTFGLDIESGIEIALSPSLSLHVGASYLTMQKAFENMHEIMVDPDLAAEFESIGYSFGGVSFSGLRATAGVIWSP